MLKKSLILSTTIICATMSGAFASESNEAPVNAQLAPAPAPVADEDQKKDKLPGAQRVGKAVGKAGEDAAKGVEKTAKKVGRFFKGKKRK